MKVTETCPMLDLLTISITIAFFAATFGLIWLSGKLQGNQP
jgi:hypothetical protein